MKKMALVLVVVLMMVWCFAGTGFSADVVDIGQKGQKVDLATANRFWSQTEGRTPNSRIEVAPLSSTTTRVPAVIELVGSSDGYSIYFQTTKYFVGPIYVALRISYPDNPSAGQIIIGPLNHNLASPSLVGWNLQQSGYSVLDYFDHPMYEIFVVGSTSSGTFVAGSVKAKYGTGPEVTFAELITVVSDYPSTINLRAKLLVDSSEFYDGFPALLWGWGSETYVWDKNTIGVVIFGMSGGYLPPSGKVVQVTITNMYGWCKTIPIVFWAPQKG